MISNRKPWIILVSAICIVACVSDLILMYILGLRYPGFNQATDTLSTLGSTSSPVSNLTSGWWVILGMVLILFAVAFYAAYRERGRGAVVAAILIAVYGAGEGLGSGLFKVSHTGEVLTVATIIHDAVGAFGIIALLILPLVVRRLFPGKKEYPFHIFSGIIFSIGIISSLLFLSRYTGDNFFYHYRGLWQRITLVNIYVYLVVIAVRMMRL